MVDLAQPAANMAPNGNGNGGGEVTKEKAQQAAQEGQQTTERIVNEDEKNIEANTGIAQTSQRRTEAGVFWLELLADPLGKLQKTVDEAFPGDGPAQSFVKDLLSGLQSGQLDPESSLAAYSNSGSPTSYSGPNVIAGMGQGTPISSRGMSRSGKGINGVTECMRNALISTVATAGKIAAGKAGLSGDSLRAVSALHQTVAGLASIADDFVSIVMTLPVETLSLFLVDKEALLEQLEGYVDKVSTVLLSLTSEDYGFDHQAIIREAMGLLGKAESDTSTVESILLQGGNFLEDVWDRAEDKIDDAATLFLNTEFDFPVNSKQLRMAGYLIGMNTTLQVLLCRQAIIERIYANISTLTVDWEATARFDNLFAPVVNQVSCMLRAIMNDMSATLNKNTSLTFITKEKEWYLLLRTILVFMKNAKNMAGKAATLEQTEEFSESFSADAFVLNNPNDFTALVSLVNELKVQARGAMTVELANPMRVEKIVEAIKVEIDRQKTITSEIEDRLSQYASNFNSESMAQAVTVMSGIIDFAKSRNLAGMVRALKEGNIKEFFSSAFESSDEERALTNIADLVGYARTNMPEEVPALRTSFETLRGRVRGENLFKRLVSTSADSYVRLQKEERQPRNNYLKRSLERINKKLRGFDAAISDAGDALAQVQDRIDMVSGKIDSAVSTITDEVTRPTQDRPVSCSSR